MPQLVGKNTEYLLLSGSGEKGSFIAVSVPAAPGCGSINLSLPVSCADISKVSSRRSSVITGVGSFYDSHMSKKRIFSCSFDMRIYGYVGLFTQVLQHPVGYLYKKKRHCFVVIMIIHI